MAKAYKLKAPLREQYVAKAVKEITNSDNAFKLMDRNVLKAMSAGMGQSILEATAFETAVAATLFESPVLEGQDVGDLVTNIAFGGLVFGAVGGVLDATRAAFAVKKGLKVSDPQAMPWKHIHEVPAEFSSSDRLLNYYDQIHSIPEVPKVFASERISYLQGAARKKVSKLQDNIRAEFGVLTNGDNVVADQLFTLTKTADSQTTLGNYLGARQVTRLNEATKLDTHVNKLQKRMLGSGDDAVQATEEYSRYTRTYTRNWGEGIGNITADTPKITHVADTLKKGDALELIKGGGLKAGKTTYTFKRPSAKKIDPWDVTGAKPLIADARYVWARKLPPFAEGQVIFQKDLPLLEKAYREFSPTFKVRLTEGGEMSFTGAEDLLAFIKATKDELLHTLHTKAIKTAGKGKVSITQEELATTLNVRNSYLSGDVADDVTRDIFALDSYAADYTKHLVKGGARGVDDGIVNVWELPQHTKTITDTTPVQGLDGNVLEGMATIAQRQAEYFNSVNRAAASILGEEFAHLPDITAKDVMQANRLGAGSGFAAAASANYGTLASKTEYIGNVVSGMIEKAQSTTRETFEASLYNLTQSTEAAIEWSTLNANLRSIPMPYALNDAGTALIPAVVKRYLVLKAAGKSVSKPILKVADAPLEIPLKTDAVRKLAKIHIEVNAGVRGKQQLLRTAQGVEHHVDLDSFYPTPVDPKDFPFFATVSDNTITGTGHTKTLYANTQRELDSMIKKIEHEPGLVIRTKAEAERYYKSIGQFDFDKTLHENFIDGALHRKGISAPYYVATDPQKIASELLAWHTKRASSLVRETVAAKYENVFTELKTLGDAYTNLATSKLGSASLVKYADDVVENPYMDYVRTALSVRNYADYPFWVSANRMLDGKLSQMYARVTETVEGAKSTDELLEVNKTLRSFGYKGAAYDEGMELLANHTAPKGVVSNFVQKANSLLATVVLRLDHLNAATNAISANILLGAETKSVIRAIERGDALAAGELAKLMKIKVPGTGKLMMAPSKMIAKAMAKFGKDTPELAFYKKHRFVTSISDQYRWTLDQLTLGGKESVVDLKSKITRVHKALRKAADKGERWTGNRLAEEFNRFVAADVMKQITDVAVKHKVMDSKTALSYINTFVNRTQGNYLAAQRPMMFQGPVGQAIGLFQTYQFNLMQQLLRYVGEGSAKDAMTLMGLQGTIFGMNGLPAFNAINTHLIGTASGNSEHKDLYDTTYGAAGKDAGDWLMYGVASNMMLLPDAKVNLYVRGDINPRHVTIVPTNPADVPIYGAYSKFFKNLFATTDQLIKGGDVSSTILRGIEHNGISRPLAGLAQTLQGLDNPNHASYSTSNRGNVIAANDLLSLANMARLVGGKPMGEAIAVDAAFRFRAYAATDNNRRRKLGSAIKNSMIAGRLPTQDEVEDFAESYVKLGGKQTEFNKFMLKRYKEANTSQVNALQRNLNSPFAQSMQTLMGGYELRDFSR